MYKIEVGLEYTQTQNEDNEEKVVEGSNLGECVRGIQINVLPYLE